MIVTLTGPNDFMIGYELNRLKESFLRQYSELGLEKLDGEEATSERLIEAAQSLPFLASRKLVILKNPGAQKEFSDSIAHIVNGIPQTTDLVIIEPKLDKRSTYYKELKTKTQLNEYTQLETNLLSNWIVQYVKEHDGNIAPAEARYLVERVGQNQQLLASELDKLLIYRSKISRASVDLLTEPTPQSTIFELLDAAFAGDSNKTMKLYAQQRAMKVEPQQIVAMLAWQLHVLAIVKTAEQRTTNEIAKEARLNPFVVGKTMAIAKKITLQDVKRLINRALKLDTSLKSQNIDTDDALQHYLLTLAD